MVIHHQSLGPHSECTFEYFKIGSTDLNLNGCIENLCNGHYEPAINIFLQQTSVFSVKCFIREREERKRKKIVLLVHSSSAREPWIGSDIIQTGLTEGKICA
jgi:hypothetical protein